MNTLPKLCILAGGGGAPAQLIRACREIDRPFHLVCLEGHADADLCEGVSACTHLGLGDLAKLRDLCRAESIEEMVMIGRVRRPSISELKPDWLTLKLIAKVGLTSLGDDGLLRSLGKVLEEECGVRMIGAGDVFGGLLTPEGILTRQSPDEQAQSDIRRAIEIAQTLGRLDVGQAVIVQQGMVLGVEAIEGTDALIARSRDVRREGQGGVLIKLAKPQQDNRFDLPTIGVDTVRNAAAAGLAGIAVEAGRSLIVGRDATLEAADMLNLFVVGLKLPERNDA